MNVSDVVRNDIAIGLKNALSLIGATILWLLTCWIPYLNVGTTIALVTMPVALSKGEVISPMEIFNAKYRESMGEFFLLISFQSLGIMIGYLFMGIPGIVMSLSWLLAPMLLVDKGMNPMQALNESNKRTNGHKWTIFFSLLVANLLYMVVYFLGMLLMSAAPILGAIVVVLLSLAVIPVFYGIYAEIYKHLGN